MGHLWRVMHLTVTCFLFYSSILTILPFSVDIMIGAVCPGQSECSQVIFVTGAQQLVCGVGTVVMSPILGSMSDDYGRRPVFLTILFSAIVPAVLLAYSRAKLVIFVWILLNMIIIILRDSGFLPTVYAYVADVVDERYRAQAVGLVMASISVGFLFGTSAALLISANQAFLTAAVLQILAAFYMKFFVNSNPREPLLLAEQPESEKLLLKTLKRQTASLSEAARTVRKSRLLRTIALVDFLTSFGVASMNSFLLYYLRAVFYFGSDEYAVIVIIAAIAAAGGQIVLYPILLHFTGERGLLWIGLAGTIGHFLLYGFAWAQWVPYAAAAFALFASLIAPVNASLVSRGAEQDQQGKVQGFMCGARSAGVIISPLIMTPLTASSLGDNPPFNMRGLPFVLCGVIMVVAWAISLLVPAPETPGYSHKPVDYLAVPLPPEDFLNVTTPPEDVLQIPIYCSECDDFDKNEKIDGRHGTVAQ